HQAPTRAHPQDALWCLEFGVSLELGAWGLELLYGFFAALLVRLVAAFVCFSTSSGLSTSIFAPALSSSAEGTRMMSLVKGAGGGAGCGASAATNSISKISAAPPSMWGGDPRSP